MVDRLNDIAYDFHYRNLDSTYYYATLADSLSRGYDDGKAAALNNLAFYYIAKMDYDTAYALSRQVAKETDNQVELLVADIQLMRLCQRESRNKDFYAYREQARQRLRRVDEEPGRLSERQRRRMVYARSEFHVVEATYFYYVDNIDSFVHALRAIDREEVKRDTAQYLEYLYNMGAGDAFSREDMTHEAQMELEFDCLLKCYTLAGDKYPYWEANALQAMAEHLWDDQDREELSRVFHYELNEHRAHYKLDKTPYFVPLFEMALPDTLKALDLAQRSLLGFSEYGDVYQTAGANRTLAQTYFIMGDYESALFCLDRALHADSAAIRQAPDLVASILEELSMTYSALNNKRRSDYYRNIYLDIQEQTRQDRFLEARVAQLGRNSRILSAMIAAVVVMIVLIVAWLFFLSRKRAKAERGHPLSQLLDPLRQWQERNQAHASALASQAEELREKYQMSLLLKEKQLTRNIEQRAKVQLVNSVTPFIDRMAREVEMLSTKEETPERRAERYQYMMELTEKINEYNDVLTRWIEMRKGELQLKIESFPLQPLFDIVAKGKMTYGMKGILLRVKPTDAVVKADRTLTLFMVNTIADNARKFTPAGGEVTIEATPSPGSVEISVSDTGEGMSEETLRHLFDRAYTGGHGFGLLNCKGIIEKYKKVSSIFHVCDIQATSQLGKGSRISFRLPRGVTRALLWLCGLLLLGSLDSWAGATSDSRVARELTDSAYEANIEGRYGQALRFADSASRGVERYAATLAPRSPRARGYAWDYSRSDEWNWYQEGLPLPYDVLLTLCNERAVSALALHRWDIYRESNKAYTELFRAYSADSTLPSYVSALQQSETNKNVAVVLLVLLMLSIFPVYYLLYYRFVLYRRFALEKVHAINDILLSGVDNEEKLSRIETLWNHRQETAADHQELSDIVREIEDALRRGITADKDRSTSLEMAADECRRVDYENERLYVSNSVLDNCLSTLKHETMYYPARVKALLSDHGGDVADLRELVDYYRSLYGMLSRQASQQVEGTLRLDESLVDYLLSTLRKIAGETQVSAGTPGGQDDYIIYKVYMPRVSYSEEQCQNLFTPLTADLRYLVCKQVVREMGEATNLRRCGILALPAPEGTEIRVILPKPKRHKL